MNRDDTISRQLAVDALRDMAVPLSKDPGCKDRCERDRTISIAWNDAVSIVDSTSNAKAEQDVCNDLMEFIDKEKVKDNKPPADWIAQWILESVIFDKCTITGIATDRSKKKMYVEFSFYQEKKDE